MSRLPNSYYEAVQGRLRGLLIRVEDQLSKETAELVSEFIDANECGLALETLSEMLHDSGARVGPEVVDDVRDLAAVMQLDECVADRLAERGVR